jgi:DNA-binding MarR family transcriptional regulator
MNTREQKTATAADARAPASAEPGARVDWRAALTDERMAHLIKDAFRFTSGALRKRLNRHAVLYGHWTLLRILWQTDGMFQRQLAERAGVSQPAAFSALQAMERLGLVRRQKMPDNRKQVRVFVTPMGMALRSPIVNAAEEVNHVALLGIPPEDIAATRRTLLALIENLSADLDEADFADES